MTEVQQYRPVQVPTGWGYALFRKGQGEAWICIREPIAQMARSFRGAVKKVNSLNKTCGMPEYIVPDHCRNFK